MNPEQPISQGTKILATLTLTPAVTVSNVALSYLLPAGMKLENPRLDDGDDNEGEGENGDKNGVRFDVRDDRLIIFIDRLSSKTEYHFAMRAVTRGSFAMPPLAAEGMYDPGVHFIGQMGNNVTIK
jgi:uncharacterized protein YfaS (alpha-2-macroglobulin family)